MTETTERFLQEIAARVGYDRVAELYLFPVIRQGGVEGAVAVVAAYPETVAEPVEPPPDGAQQEVSGSASSTESAPESAPESPAQLPTESPTQSPTESEAGEPMESVVVGEPEHATARRPERARHVVYTARYRNTIKGTDRGRWLVEVVAEGDAPLVTVEEVVRGVVRRSGEAFQPERISGDQFRALVPAPAAPGSAPA